MATSYRRIDAVIKTGHILKFIGSKNKPVTAPDIARVTGFPVGTVMCHLVSLAEHGFVRQLNDSWELGMGMALLWARVKSNLETQRDRIDRDLESISMQGGN